MEPDDKKNESEVKVIRELDIKVTKEALVALTKRVKALEEHLMSLDHGSDGNHPNDGGWFQ